MHRNKKAAFFLLLPIGILMILLVFYPILVTFYNSLHEMNLIRLSEMRFVGWDNYVNVLKDRGFQDAIVNTLVILIAVTGITLTASMLEALMLQRDHKISKVLTAIAIIPWALPPMVNGIIWRFVFYPGYGLINKILYNLKWIDAPVLWASDRWTTLLIAAIIVAWRIVPFCAIVLLSNLQSIDQELYEAARVDGANKWEIFRSVTLPLLLPSMGIVMTNITIAGFNAFDELVALMGYREMGQTIMMYNYTQTFSFLNFGLGSAISYIIMLGSGVFAYFYIRQLGRSQR